MFKVYLAGPIADRTFKDAQTWRTGAAEYLRAISNGLIQAYSPLRGKEFLDTDEIIGTQEFAEHPLATSAGVIGRDGFDVRTCDVMLINAMGVTKLSGGTAWELGVAWQLGKIVIMVAPEVDNPYRQHLILSRTPSFTVDTLAEACDLVAQVLLPNYTSPTYIAEVNHGS